MNSKIFQILFLLGMPLLIISAPTFGDIVFRNVIYGEELDLSKGKEGEETEAVEHFKKTGENLYNDDEEAWRSGYDLYATACAGCHGHHAEGKLGPNLIDDYWTYNTGKTDKGLFEIIYGGARAMMGPQRGNLTIDEMLKIMGWLRAAYQGDPSEAKWMTPEEQKNFKPIPVDHFDDKESG